MDFVSLLAPPKVTRSLLTSPSSLFSAAISLRIVLLLYGLYQDANSPLKYTDIDYNVFTDAARYVSYGHSPYLRDTYRYTPLLAWILLPTTWEPQHIWFSFGKALFAISDIVAGWMIFVVLQKRGLSQPRALKYSSIWLLNPMVATISTRGSSEGLLCVMVMALLWATEMRYIALSGMLLGLSVHFKIYPFIYGVSILLSLDTPAPPLANPSIKSDKRLSILRRLSVFLNQDRLTLIFTSLATFSLLNISMYSLYGTPFMQHTYLHHLTRIDHRHNFSPYNTLLYLSSAKSSTIATSQPSLRFESLAFIPQLLLSTLLIPVLLTTSKSRSDSLPRTLLTQTLSFVTFNKVCTSQYFLWYLIFLPLYLPQSVLIRQPKRGLSVLAAWIGGQGLWLWQAYRLEMLGESTFVPGLWVAGLGVFGVNCWILGIMVSDDEEEEIAKDLAAVEQKPGTPIPREKTLKDEGVLGTDDDDDDDDDDDEDYGSDVEEIPRGEMFGDPTVEEMVREEMRRRKGKGASSATKADSGPPGSQQTNAMLSDYMADLGNLDPDQ